MLLSSLELQLVAERFQTEQAASYAFWSARHDPYRVPVGCRSVAHLDVPCARIRPTEARHRVGATCPHGLCDLVFRSHVFSEPVRS